MRRAANKIAQFRETVTRRLRNDCNQGVRQIVATFAGKISGPRVDDEETAGVSPLLLPSLFMRSASPRVEGRADSGASRLTRLLFLPAGSWKRGSARASDDPPAKMALTVVPSARVFNGNGESLLIKVCNQQQQPGGSLAAVKLGIASVKIAMRFVVRKDNSEAIARMQVGTSSTARYADVVIPHGE